MGFNDPAPMLSETSLIRYFMYAHARQPGQTPKEYYLWSFLTTLAALVQDKYYFYKFNDHPMLPNLTTFLVGPSGLGKGTAINAATDYLTPYNELLRVFPGRCTHAAWMRFVTTPKIVPGEYAESVKRSSEGNGTVPDPVVAAFLVTEELAFGLGEGERAREFIRMWTQAYTQTGRAFKEATEMHGLRVLSNPCWNWLAGTTKVWLLDAVGIVNILSGFAARAVWIIEDYNLAKLGSWPTYPEDFKEVKKYIEYRLALLLWDKGGEIKLHPSARYTLDKWSGGWNERARNEPELNLLPLYMRGHDLALKLCMLLRIADMDLHDPERFIVRSDEVTQATLWVENLMSVHYPRLLATAAKGGADKEVAQTDKIGELVRKFRQGECTRSALCKKAHNVGIHAKGLDLALKSLMEQGLVEIVPGIGGKNGYFRWVERSLEG